MESTPAELLGPPTNQTRKDRAEALKRELKELLGLIQSGQALRAAERIELLLGLINGFLASCAAKEKDENGP